MGRQGVRAGWESIPPHLRAEIDAIARSPVVTSTLPALRLDGGPPPSQLFAATHLGQPADDDAVNAFLAAFAGFFTRQALLDPPPGLPTLRSFQAAHGRVARSWLGERMGW